MSKIKLGKTGDSRTRAKAKETVLSPQVLALKESFDSHNGAFIDYLLAKGFSSTTVKNYTRDVKHFEEWIEQENIQLETLTYADVLHYIQCKRGQVKQRSSSIRVNSIRHYFDYLVSTNLLVDNPASSIVIKGVRRKMLYTILTKQELEDIYHSFEFKLDEKQKNQNWYKSALLAFKRNKIVVGLIVYQGLNTTDLSRLKLKDLKLREGKIYIGSSRRSNERELTLEAVQILDLMEYVLKTREELLAEENKESENLIISAGSGNKINNMMFLLLKKLRKQNSNISSFKQIRTSVITYWLRQYNLRQAQYMAGHRYVSSTEAYYINDLDGLSEDVTKFHPLS